MYMTKMATNPIFDNLLWNQWTEFHDWNWVNIVSKDYEYQGQGVLIHFYVLCIVLCPESGERIQDHWSSSGCIVKLAFA